MPTKIWAVGEEVLAADFNSYVQRQVVATFPNAAARTAAVATPAAGMVTYLVDVNAFEYWNGAAWRPMGGPGYGQLAYKTKAADQTGIITGTTVDVADLTATVTVGAGRRVQLNAEVGIFKAAPDVTGWVTVYITDAGNVEAVGRNVYIGAPGYSTAYASVRVNPPGGSATYKVRISSAPGGYVNVSSGARFWIDDVGPASMPT